MKPETGLVLRLIGPLIEVVCVGLLFAVRGRGWTVAGRPLEWFCFAGFGVGFLLVIVGLVMVRSAPRRRQN